VATFQVAASDPDDQVSENCAVIDFGDGTRAATPCNDPSCPALYGAAAPPPATPGRLVTEYRHIYGAPGTYTATFVFRSGGGRCHDPYASGPAGQRATFFVHP
jgi:hypothetical protein